MKRSLLKKILLASALLSTLILLKYFEILDHLSLAWVNEHVDQLLAMTQQHYGLAVGIFIALYAIVSACAVPGSSVFMTCGGLLFGVFPGIIFINIGATLGGTLLFLISRYIVGSWVQEKYAVRLHNFNAEMVTHGYFYALMSRLVGVLPFFLVNLFSGVTLLPLRTFVWTTSVGLLPLSLFCAYTGQQLAHITRVDDFFQPSLSVAFGSFLAFRLCLIPIMFRHFKLRKKHGSV